MSNPTADDRRAAANLSTTLSSYVITAALAVLGADAAIVTFVLDKRTDLTWFYRVNIAGAALLVIGVILGGRGIWNIIEDGANGDWQTKPGYRLFDFQAWFVLLGAVCIFVSVFLGTPK